MALFTSSFSQRNPHVSNTCKTLVWTLTLGLGAGLPFRASPDDITSFFLTDPPIQLVNVRFPLIPCCEFPRGSQHASADNMVPGFRVLVSWRQSLLQCASWSSKECSVLFCSTAKSIVACSVCLDSPYARLGIPR